MASIEDHRFQEWLDKIEVILWDKYQCSRHDLPDWDFWDAFASNVTPAVAARRLYKHAMTF